MSFNVGDKAVSKYSEIVYDVVMAKNGNVTFHYEDDNVEQNITMPVEVAESHFERLCLEQEDGECEGCENICIPLSDWNELHRKLNLLDERIANVYDEFDNVTDAFQDVIDYIANNEGCLQ